MADELEALATHTAKSGVQEYMLRFSFDPQVDQLAAELQRDTKPRGKADDPCTPFRYVASAVALSRLGDPTTQFLFKSEHVRVPPSGQCPNKGVKLKQRLGLLLQPG
jgi:hypothetical protein